MCLECVKNGTYVDTNLYIRQAGQLDLLEKLLTLDDEFTMTDLLEFIDRRKENEI